VTPLNQTRLTYATPPGLLIGGRTVISVCVSVMSDRFAGWTAWLPWSGVIAVAVAIWFGQILADLRNDRSWLRDYLRRKGRLFEIAAPLPEFGIVLGIILTLRFTRAMRGTTILLHLVGSTPRTVILARPAHIARGEELRIRLISGQVEAIDQGNLFWNPDGTDRVAALWSCEYLATIEVQRRFSLWHQKFKLYVKLPKDAAKGAGLTIFHGQRDLLDETTINNAKGGYL
jgi:hypothetical protein